MELRILIKVIVKKGVSYLLAERILFLGVQKRPFVLIICLILYILSLYFYLKSLIRMVCPKSESILPLSQASVLTSTVIDYDVSISD